MVSKESLATFFTKKFKQSQNKQCKVPVFFFLSFVVICYFFCTLFSCFLYYFWQDSDFASSPLKCLYSFSNFVIYWANPHKNIPIWKTCILEIFKSSTNLSQFNTIYVIIYIHIHSSWVISINLFRVTFLITYLSYYSVVFHTQNNM